jgi:ribonuclease P protein component
VLPAAHRLTESGEFRRVVRHGRRSGSRTLVIHLLVEEASPDPGPQVGFVVSKAVGNAVVRNRVQRRLRHLCREHLTVLPATGVLVVRALPAAAGAGHEELRADLVRCLQRVVRP